MFDVRALLVGRARQPGDGAYFELADTPPAPLEEMLRSWTTRLACGGARQAAEFLKSANALEAAQIAKDEQTLKQSLKALARQMQQRGFSDHLLAQAFAVVREASRRTLGLRHHDVQLLAGRALLQGKIAEMATGEGKTLAATLASCTAAAAGVAVHVVTVNDYLATRDATQNLALFAFFELTTGIVKQDMPLDERRRQYESNIVYVSNKELTFDYLKDRLALGSTLRAHEKLRALYDGRASSKPILQGLHMAIVDEADSVLIDEARTPLVISETLPGELPEEIYRQAILIATKLEPDVDFIMNRHREIWITESGHANILAISSKLGHIWKSALWQRDLLNKALSACHAFHRDQHYIVSENKVQIVDEFTGRVMPDRTWERGLHQMIEAKEGCEITGQRKTLSQITYQRFFGRYLLLAGMTGTAKEIEPELKRVYDLSVARIPTHKPSRRVRLPDRVFRDPDAHWAEVARRAIAVAGEGRPVLVGTRSVETSERLSRLLEQHGMTHTTLNARQDKMEADAVAQAGQPGRITVATNMAGRGTDIGLSPEVVAKGGLHVILTELHESARIDRQLFGRSARQGDPGTVEAIVCLQDVLFRRYAPYMTTSLIPALVRRAFGGMMLFRLLVKYAQLKAERRNRLIRLETIKRDRKWLQALGFIGSAKK